MAKERRRSNPRVDWMFGKDSEWLLFIFWVRIPPFFSPRWVPEITFWDETSKGIEILFLFLSLDFHWRKPEIIWEGRQKVRQCFKKLKKGNPLEWAEAQEARYILERDTSPLTWRKIRLGNREEINFNKRGSSR